MSWKKSTIGDVLSVIKNGINCEQNKIPVGEKITRIETIAKKRFDFERVGYANLTESEKERSQLKVGDILFSHINSPIHVGKTAIYEGEEDIYHGINLLLMRTNEDVNPNFFNHFLNHLLVTGYWEENCKKSVNQASVNQKDISKVEFNYPPLSIQKKIVTKLDAIYAEIDKATAAADANAKNAEALFQSYLTQVFEHGGEGWSMKYLSDISENLDSKRIPITKDIREEGEIPYYGASGIVDYVKNYIFDENILLISEDGANLLARTYPIAFSVSGKCWVNNHAHVVRFSNLITQVFVEFYLNSISLKPYVSGMAQPKLNQSMLNKIPIPFPSLEEQGKLVNLFLSIKKSADISKKSYLAKVKEFSFFKQSILKLAFNGELVKE